MFNTRPMFTAFALCAMVLSAESGSAASVLARYAFDGNSLASSDASTDWSTSNLGSGGGVPLGFDGGTGQPAPSLALTMGSINDGTLLDNDYYTFTVTPDAGYELSFTQFSYDMNKVSGGADVFGRLYSSIDGFISEIGFGTNSAQNTWQTKSISLAALPTVTTATEFRLYLITSGTFGANSIKLDNIILTGDANSTAAPIPSPAAAAIGMFGLGALVARRKRR